MRQRWSDLALPSALLLCIIVTMLRFPLAVNHDCALFLSYARRILDGETPYVDFYEINPPLAMYLGIPPVWIGRVLGVNPILVWNALVLAACVWSAISIRRTMIELDVPGRGLVLTAWFGLALVTELALTLGQREQLFVFAYVPFLLLRVARWADREIPKRRAIGHGIYAGVMIALKPQFALVALAPELYWIVRHRRFRPLATPEIAACVATGAVYLLHFAVVPAIGRAYLLDLMPQLWSVYGSFDDPWSQVVDPYRCAWVAAAVCLEAFNRPADQRDPSADITGGLTVFAVAAFALLYLAARKDWPYHFEPALDASVLVIAFVIARSRVLAVAMRRRSALAIAGAALAFVAIAQLDPGAEHQRVPNIEKAIVEHSQRGDAVMMLTCRVPPTFPLLVQLDRRSASRYSSLVNMIPQFYPPARPFGGYHKGDQLGAAERGFLAALRDDVQRHAPVLLVVLRTCREAPVGFDLWTYLDEEGFIRDAFGGFEKIGTLEDHQGRAQYVVLGPAGSR